MMDSDYKHHPNEQETRQKPKWVPLREMLSEGTIGFDLALSIPTLLERERPETIFYQDPSFLWGRRKSNALSEIQNHNITTIFDLLNLSPDELSTYTFNEAIKEHILGYLKSNVLIPPHAQILKEVTCLPKIQIPHYREKELITVVEKALGIFDKTEQRVIKERFGLDDGRILSRGEVSKKLSMDPNDVTKITTKVIHKLRIPLMSYFPLSVESFGWQIFNAVFIKDLPPLEGYDVSDLELDESIEQELEKKYNYNFKKHFYNLRHFLAKNFDELPAKAREEIQNRIRNFVEKESNRINNAHHSNNLIPSIEITEEKYTEIAEVSIEKLDLGPRNHNTLEINGFLTLGQLLRVTKKRLARIKKISEPCASEIEEKLLNMLL